MDLRYIDRHNQTEPATFSILHFWVFLRVQFLCSPKNFGGAYSRRVVRPSVRTSRIRVRPITLLFEVGF
jgi:hypothetical protein